MIHNLIFGQSKLKTITVKLVQELEVRISCCRESKCNAPKKYRWNQQILVEEKMDDQRGSIANSPSLLLPKGLPNTKEKALAIDNR